jgi:dinuclear metal center YbgI/SA1388 family protein
MHTVASIAQALDRFARCGLAADWDNVGLLLGDRDAPVRRLMTCLTITPEVVREAIATRTDLIVSHHPILFRPIKRLTTATSEGRMVLDLARANVAVYSPHTAFDNTRGGINDLLAQRLGLVDVEPLRCRPGGRTACKIVVFTPDADLARVSDALFEAGAGRIGEYRECSFRLAGKGTFHGSEAANPTIGAKGRREEVDEWRLEVVCPEERVEEAVRAMRRAHSYEEPAYDVVPLRPDSVGEGRLGRLESPRKLTDLAALVKTQLRVSMVQLVGSGDRVVVRVAIVCGSGGEFLTDAANQGAELFLTGEARYHDALAAEALGVAMIVAGHHATERLGVEQLAAKLSRDWPELEIWASRSERDPQTWV